MELPNEIVGLSDWKYKLSQYFGVAYGRTVAFCIVEDHLMLSYLGLKRRERLILRYDSRTKHDAEMERPDGSVKRLSRVQLEDVLEHVKVVG